MEQRLVTARRSILLAGAALLARPAWAQQGWRPFEGHPPLYLEGVVKIIVWANPHPHLELLQNPGASVPDDLQRRPLQPQRRPGSSTPLLQDAVAAPANERTWRVELPPLPRLLAWDVQRPKIGQVLGVVGRPGPPLADTPTVQAAILFVDGKGYPLHDEPA